MIADQRKYSVQEIRCKHFNVYYRVMADGVELPSTVFIMPSQKTTRSIAQLKTWCKQNSHLLADGQVVRADLDEVDSEIPTGLDNATKHIRADKVGFSRPLRTGYLEMIREYMKPIPR